MPESRSAVNELSAASASRTSANRTRMRRRKNSIMATSGGARHSSASVMPELSQAIAISTAAMLLMSSRMEMLPCERASESASTSLVARVRTWPVGCPSKKRCDRPSVCLTSRCRSR